MIGCNNMLMLKVCKSVSFGSAGGGLFEILKSCSCSSRNLVLWTMNVAIVEAVLDNKVYTTKLTNMIVARPRQRRLFSPISKYSVLEEVRVKRFVVIQEAIS